MQTNRRLVSGLAVLMALLPWSAAFGGDTIYELTGDDGSISLSNVPTSRGYRPLVGDRSGEPRAGERRSATRPAAKARFDGLVSQTASAVGVDSALLHAVISVESRYDPAARSRKGASGLMQLMPATAKRYGVADAFDPAQNLQGGAMYLRDLLRQYDSDVELALAAYNAGEGAVAKHGNRIPPYVETADYVPRVLAYYRKYQADAQAQN